MRKISYFLLLVVLGLFCIFVSCSSEGTYDGQEGPYESFVETNRKVYYVVDIDYEKGDFREDVSNIKSKAIELGGYTTSSSFTYGKNARGNCTYRVPTEHLDEFLNYIDSLGGVENTTINAFDITTTYDETAAKIETLKASKEAYLLKLQDTSLADYEIKSITDAIKDIDKEIAELEKTKSNKDDLMNYSTINISYNVDDNSLSVFFSNYGEYLVDFLMVVLRIVLYLLPICAVGTGIVFGVIGLDKLSKKKKDKKVEVNQNNK